MGSAPTAGASATDPTSVLHVPTVCQTHRTNKQTINQSINQAWMRGRERGREGGTQERKRRDKLILFVEPLQVVVSPQGSYPSIVATVTTPTGAKKRFTMAMVQISEEGPFGDLVRSVDLSSIAFNVDYTFDATHQYWTFRTNISGYGQMRVYLAKYFRHITIHFDDD